MSLQLNADYNVTCPDYRYCQVRHKYQSPCPLWDCSPCYWGDSNCTKTEEDPSLNCPYAVCEDLPRPNHTSTATIVLSVVSAVVFLSFFVTFLIRRLRQQVASEEDDVEGVQERVPLLERCRALLPTFTPSVLQRFRDVIFGDRPNPAPPERPEAQDDLPENQQEDDDDAHRPSAPPPSYEEFQEQEANRRPIVRVRNWQGHGLVNQNYGSFDQSRYSRRQQTQQQEQEQQLQQQEELQDEEDEEESRVRRAATMEEVPLSQSLK